ncbi:hypothetical protein HanXRQr2_Chr03g0114401 [Helianthus annuus]|uniref:Uncharacterized protein n=1 Tax=Helianthus annuus TaxID=4232 RepID=A0A9K3NW39_HELAN|nr:hypothetical protein HanXRQr2_Chr03g0114401 [Helianthus annuus]KAJ0943962.1 hypothetical protein HanPSC8_Chr03g0110741 [Helianthus annuus]
MLYTHRKHIILSSIIKILSQITKFYLISFFKSPKERITFTNYHQISSPISI